MHTHIPSRLPHNFKCIQIWDFLLCFIKVACICSSYAAFHVESYISRIFASNLLHYILCENSYTKVLLASACKWRQHKQHNGFTGQCVYITRSKNKVVLKQLVWLLLFTALNISTPVTMGYVENKFCDKINFLSDI